MKHLALITDAWQPQINGVVTTLTHVVRLLEARGWKITVIHPGLFKQAPMPGYPEIKVALNPWKLRSMLRDIQPTHVHVAVEGSLGITARLLLKHWGWCYTSAYHTNFPEYLEQHLRIPTWLTIPLVRWFHRQSSAVLTPSQTTANKLGSWGIKRAAVWGRGFDREVFTPVIRPSPTGDLKLLYVGRVSVEKNIEDFLKLQRPDWSLTVVGDGPARATLEKSYPETVFVGFKTGAELARFYQDADVFVFPSRSDTLGVVMIEAMACGTPVAAYRVEGPNDLVINGVNGLKHSDDLGIATYLASWVARETVAASAQKHTWEACADTFERCLVPVTRE